MKRVHIHNILRKIYPFSFVFLFILSSCLPVRHLQNDEYLFTQSKINVNKRQTDVVSLKRHERISPNKKVLGVRLHLFLYNLANPEKEKFPHGWLKRIGEVPVLYDSVMVLQTAENFKEYFTDRGFNRVKVESSVKEKFKKAKAKYDIELGDPTLINSISYSFEDTSIQQFILADTSMSLIKVNGIFDKLLFQEERQRIEMLLKNNGYYSFSREYIHFEVSRTGNSLRVDVVLKIKQNLSGVFDPAARVKKHKQYKINNVIIVPNHSNFEGIRRNDTVYYNRQKVLYYTKPIIKASTLVAANNCLPGSFYSLKNVERSYNDFSSLGLFRYVNINFNKVNSNNEYGQLDCKIDLAMRKRQSYAFEIVATNSDGDFGVRGNITYNNYNIFKGGEHLQLGFSGAIESLKKRLKVEPMREVGATAKLETPKFLLPFRAKDFQRKFKPRTELHISYNYQNQPKYNRTIANASFGYNWRGNTLNKHTLLPVDFYLVKLPRLDTLYIDTTYGGTRLENSFTNHTILGGRYSFEYNNQQIKKGRSFIYLRYNFETAGLLLNLINKMSGWGNDSLLFGVQYFQYFKTDLDFRNYYIISPCNRLVYRLYGGIGIPYGNSKAMPFEKMYWSGGPYGIRAWGERTLGPGSYFSLSPYNQLGDIKIEANLEYRFKVIWKLESALFLDAGNIWLLEDAPELSGSGFKWDTFYNDIAMGVGFGLRFDLSFVLLRTDFGFKLRDPSIPDGSSKWTFENPTRDFWDLTFQFGLGYPF